MYFLIFFFVLFVNFCVLSVKSLHILLILFFSKANMEYILINEVLFMNWRNKFSNFMYGRYGIDNLSRFTLGLTFVLCILSFFIHGRLNGLLSFLILVSIIIIYFRMFSRNIYKRAAENEKFLKFTGRFKNSRQNAEKYATQRKYYKFFKCPGCGQKIRIPKGHGKIEIRCPKCNTRFIKRS